MTISERASDLYHHIDNSPDGGDFFQYYRGVINLLRKAMDNELSAENKIQLLLVLPKFKDSKLNANDLIDALIDEIRSSQAGGRKRRRTRRTRRRRN